MQLFPPVPNGAEEILKDRLCPACGSTRTHRSRPKTRIDRVLRALTPYRPFSCSACQWRGWRTPEMAEAVPLPPLTLKPGGPGKLTMTGAAAARRREAVVLAVAVAGSIALFVVFLRYA